MKDKMHVAILVAAMLVSTSAWAGSITELHVGSGGTVGYGKTKVAAGNGIKITDLISGSQTLNILLGRLTFTTGKSTGSSGNSWFYGPGGKFTVQGCVDVGRDHDRSCDKKDVRGRLMTGTFLNAKVIQEHGQTILIAQFLEQLNPQLAAILKLPTGAKGLLELVLSPSGSRQWLATVTGGFLEFPALPEPSSILLLGTGLVAFMLRRFVPYRAEKGTF